MKLNAVQQNAPCMNSVWQSVTKMFWNATQRSGKMRHLFRERNILVYQVCYCEGMQEKMPQWFWGFGSAKGTFLPAVTWTFLKTAKTDERSWFCPGLPTNFLSTSTSLLLLFKAFSLKKKKKRERCEGRMLAHWWHFNAWTVTLRTWSSKLLILILWNHEWVGSGS